MTKVYHLFWNVLDGKWEDTSSLPPWTLGKFDYRYLELSVLESQNNFLLAEMLRRDPSFVTVPADPTGRKPWKPTLQIMPKKL